MRIRDKAFVVTGAGNGIGREVALELLRRGARVAGADRSEAGLAETAALAVPGSAFSQHVIDLTDRAAVEALPAAVTAAHGPVDGVLHIAGIIQRFVPFDALSMQEIERLMAVNFWATVYVNKTFLPLLEARTEAALLNVSSMGGLVPVPGQGAYGASKAAVKLLTETLQAELRGSNVAVTVVFPGGVGTHITENSGVELPKLQPGATARVTPPETAGRLIVDAVEQGKPRLLIGNDAKSLDRLSRLMPTRAIFIVADRMKKLLA